MPTCKDCVHVEVCRDFLTSEISDENKKKAVQKYLSELENEMNINGCPFFKDRSKFVDKSELQQNVIRPLTNRCAEYTKSQMCLACALEIREHCEHYKKAEQALQEQHSNESVSSVNDKYNPRKPIIQKDRKTDYILCPNCFKYSGMLVDSPRCLACGQAID